MAAKRRQKPLEDWPDGLRDEYIEKQPKLVREYIAYIERALDEADVVVEDMEKVADFGEGLASLWMILAQRRQRAGDPGGATRAFRAAENARCA